MRSTRAGRPICRRSPIQYSDYVAWQREHLTPERLEALTAYWRQRLSGAPAALTLPADRLRPAVRHSDGAWTSFRIDARLVRALEALAASANATLHMTSLAAFQVLLGRYADQDDVLVGSPVSAQGRPEFKDVMGFLVNTVVHRGDLSGDPTFRELLGRTAASAREAYAHRELSIERVVEAAAPERDPGRDPLFQAMFTLQEHESPPLALAGLDCRAIRIRNTTAKADLSLLLYVDDQGLAGELEYSTDLFSATTVERMAAHFRTLLEEIAKDPDRPISRLPFITDAERRKIVVDWNRTATEFPGDRSITSLFDAQVARAPHALAVIDGSRSLTYEALDRRAKRLARRLGELGVAPRRSGRRLHRALAGGDRRVPRRALRGLRVRAARRNAPAGAPVGDAEGRERRRRRDDDRSRKRARHGDGRFVAAGRRCSMPTKRTRRMIDRRRCPNRPLTTLLT